MKRVGVSEVLVRVSQLAAGQWGLLTAAQAEREQVPRYRLARLVAAGLLERLEHGVYAVAATEMDGHRRLRAAWLALDPGRTAEERLGDLPGGVVVSHASAAGLYGLGDLLDDIPELTMSVRKQTRRGARVHRADLTAADVTLVEGLPTTTVERTVADLLRDGHDVDHVATIVGEAVRRDMVDRDTLATHLESLAHRYRRTDGRDLVEHLLDHTGQSTKALARRLAASPIGQELVAAGSLAAIERLLAPVPKLDLPNVDILGPHLQAILDAARAPTEAALTDIVNFLTRMPTVALPPWTDHVSGSAPVGELTRKDASA